MKEEEIARMLLNVVDNPLNTRMIVELNRTHKMWDDTDYSDHFMIDLSNGDGYVIKYPKSAGFYRNIKTREIQFLWHKCNGWRQLTFYGNSL